MFSCQLSAFEVNILYTVIQFWTVIIQWNCKLGNVFLLTFICNFEHLNYWISLSRSQCWIWPSGTFPPYSPFGGPVYRIYSFQCISNEHLTDSHYIIALLCFSIAILTLHACHGCLQKFQVPGIVAIHSCKNYKFSTLWKFKLQHLVYI